ncbi:MAG TPA: prepilin-type N-terminal cleavage/methylation domain-containing protein [Rhodanobacteraceae bacterium]|nr:prepilin-type N-terminal cleavage/methylation domain-containing protein [Rhodanobacteraceae bacterium]
MLSDFVTRLRARCRARGFTLVELMITIAVAAVLAMIAVPSFQRIILSNRLTTAANAFSNSLNLARLDAIKLNSTTQFCGSTTATNNSGDTLGAACGTQSGAVYSWPQSAATAGQVQATIQGLASPIQYSSAGVTGVRFSGQGYGYAPTGSSDTPFKGTVAIICTSQLSSDNWRKITMTAGSIVAVATSTGSCP